ncbi:MAG: nucleoside 2-deoxyribosyltransferase [Chloroflexota bacterium]
MKYTAFLSISFQHRKKIPEVIQTIKKVASINDIELVVFVDQYVFQQDEERQMMAVSRNDIDRSDFVLAEVSHKAVGVGVEVGYAVGTGKPVIYMRQEKAEHSTTIAGISTHHVIYSSVTELEEKLQAVIKACILRE